MVDYKSRLGWAMIEAGITLVDLAKSIGVSRQAVWKVLDGTSTALNAYNNAVAARVLQVNSDWLATGEGDPAPYPEGVALEVARRFEELSANAKEQLVRRLSDLEGRD